MAGGDRGDAGACVVTVPHGVDGCDMPVRRGQEVPAATRVTGDADGPADAPERHTAEAGNAEGVHPPAASDQPVALALRVTGDCRHIAESLVSEATGVVCDHPAPSRDDPVAAGLPVEGDADDLARASGSTAVLRAAECVHVTVG